MRIKLIKYLMDGIGVLNNLGGLRDKICLDLGAKVTIKTEKGIAQRPSENKGKTYRIVELRDSAPWNPNMHRATLGIDYNDGIVYTYLDERFNDWLII